MTANIDAVATSEEIKATYRRYLQSLLAVRDPKLDKALREAIDTTSMLDKGPYLEATPPYAPGASLQDLIDEGVLAKGFVDLESDILPLKRSLYAHQETSIRKAANGRNVIVATGTGSGKTESFLLPILDSLVREHELGELGSGVRALLLYPMNALANDQMKRLRQILASYPQVTFGRYTGDTQNDPDKARETFHELNIGEPMLDNELVSRQEMRATPPHLLLTNYAMLEYLLLRPLDMDLFDTGADSKWRFIVVDEAHVYDGAQGAEIAMLLRRVRDRVAPVRSIQCIATSATVGGDADPTSVTRFASNLFGEPFEWVEGNPARQDLIMSTRVAAPEGPFWGPLSAADYRAVADAADPDAAALASAASAGWNGSNAAVALAHEESMATLRKLLAEGPRTFDRVAVELFGEGDEARGGLAAMVELGSALRGSDLTTPLSARYHIFLRATEGAFTCLSSRGPHVQLARHELCPDCAAPVFEIGSCKRCGAVHVVGTLENEGGVTRLHPRKASTRGTWLVLGDELRVDEDEEILAEEGQDVEGAQAKLCTGCGALVGATDSTCRAPGCASTELREVRRLKQRGEDVAGCLVCGARGAATVRVFETGADASGAVITTSLYQNLPPSSDPKDVMRPGEGRKLLAFSDSRQSAAYFAPYLEDSYGRLQRRRLISQGLVSAGAEDEPVGVDDVVFETKRFATKVKHFPTRMTAQQVSRAIAPWVMAEVLSTDDRQSLEGLGLVKVSMYRDPSWTVPAPLLALGLTEDEGWAFLQELVRTLRQQGAVSMPEDVDPRDEIFAPRLGPIWARLTGPEAVRKVLSWLPGRGTNRRIDYTQKVLKALGKDGDPTALLTGAWNFLTADHTVIDWLATSTEQGLGVLHQIDHELLRLGWLGDEAPAYQCTTCRRTAPFSVRGVCPALGCEGTLEQFVPPPLAGDRDHYRAVYRSMHAVPLKAMEHTAQWQNTEAAAIQQQFIRGEINALSCSTTFELGVDVGELQAVMLRNMPPSTANYVQRAGRAGRRSGAAALVVTYAMRRSHDLSRFAEPEVMMSGAVRAPYVPLQNARIARRHAHSVALSAFFRWQFEATGRIDRNAGAFFLAGDQGDPSGSLVKGYLTPIPPELTDSLRRVLPKEVADHLGVESGAWVDYLIDLLEKVGEELAKDVRTLEELLVEAADAKKFQLADRYKQVGNTLRTRDLLGFLANRNVLPKYGFPVDSVELRTGFAAAGGAKLDLTRDLSQAIYEYAPDATLVAGGRLWTSRGIYHLPGRDLEEFKYVVCKRCGGFRQAVADLDAACANCGEIAEGSARTLTIPEFGFVAARDTDKPGPRPPQRSWSGAVHVLKQPPEPKTRRLLLPGGQIGVNVGPRGRMVAIADGPGGSGYWICDWCGHGSARMRNPRKPPKHNHLLKNKPCDGPAKLLDLAHSYETDLLTLYVDLPGFSAGQPAWKSVLYAILEAACDQMEIARDDIGGSLTPIGYEQWSLVLFDAVGGGAGHVLLVEDNLEKVLGAALKRVAACECGPETSCYGCLRSYQNQRDHEELSRGAAEQILRRLLEDEGVIDTRYLLPTEPADLPGGMPTAWGATWDDASESEREVLGQLADLEVPRPELGHETASGIPLTFSWPDSFVALAFDVTDEDRVDLLAEGWAVVPIGADLQAAVRKAQRPS